MSTALDFILQRDVRQTLIPRLGKDDWITVYGEERGPCGIFSGLVPDDRIVDVMASPYWDLHKGDGGFDVSSDGAGGHVYSRLRNEHGVEPLVIVRDFLNVRPDQVELSEEYRLFHNLIHDVDGQQYLRIMEDGEEEPVGRFKDGKFELRAHDLRQYLAIRRLHLAVYFMVFRESELRLDQLPADELHEQVRDALTCYDYYADKETIGGRAGVATFSSTIGKKLISPMPLKSCGIWPYKLPEKFETFIVGRDEAGQPVEHSCDPKLLADYFGKNKGAPHYLAPVFFRRDVLTKYVTRSSKYKLEDGQLRCASVWSLSIDNNHGELVSVALGDLGSSLPARERIYWKAYNLAPDGARISEVNRLRNFDGEWTDPQALDLAFKLAYESFHAPWMARFGWPLFQGLHEDDEHCLAALHRLIADEQSEFDAQVGYLTKLLVDALNDGAIQAQLPSKVTDEKSIAKLERWFALVNPPNASQHIDFLKKLQGIRSTSAAHGKGSNYEKLWKKLGYQGRSRLVVFDELLASATTLLTELRQWSEPPQTPAQAGESSSGLPAEPSSEAPATSPGAPDT